MKASTEPSVPAAQHRSAPAVSDVALQTRPHPRQPFRIWGKHRGRLCTVRAGRIISAACTGLAAVLTACTAAGGGCGS